GYAGYYAKEVHNGESKIVNKDGFLFYTYDGTNYLLGYEGNATDLILPESYNGENYAIYKYAFAYCDSLTSVTIGNSVTSIGNSAFSDCDSLTSVTIGNSVTSIGNSAFYNCDSLTSVTIGNSITSISDRAFYNCRSLTSVTIPDSVASIGDYAFYFCNKLVEVINKSSLNIQAGSKDYGYAGYYAKEVHNGESKIVNKDGFLFYTYDGTNYLLGYVGNETELILPESYNGEKYEIYDYAFRYCTSLTSVAIGNSVTSIGSSAFWGCSSLTSVTIGNSVTSIGDSAFYNCNSLTSVTFENPNGWWYSSSSTATSGTAISSTDLSNTWEAAQFLKSFYCDYYWRRG
ncbi:MAG: leucine-rich repeat domain-containing protein, partial [Clostridia bacterium]|nr:leucine-rich repeat domain-containing protein [Clostridia bacterium]